MTAAIKQKNIPLGWENTTLDRLLIEVGTRNKNNVDLPVLSVTNSRGFVLQSEQFARKLHSTNTKNYKVVSSGEFGYNPARINVGSIAALESPEKGLLSPMYVVFKTGRDLETDYLKQYIQTNKFNLQVKGNTAGSVRQSLNFSAFKNFDFLLPPIKEQGKIAEILGAVDEEIQKTDGIISATEKLKRGLMQQLFTRGIGHTKFKKTEIGEVPDDWRVVKIKDAPIDLIDGDRGVNYPKLQDFSSGGYCLFLTNKNIKGDSFLFSELQFITRDKDEALRKGKLQRGDVVLTTRGTVGNVAYYDNSITFENIRINSGMLILRAFEDMEEKYLYHLMKSPLLKQRYVEVASGSAQPQLPIRNLEHIYVPLPPEDEQLKIVAVSESVDQKIAVNQKLKAHLTILKKGLMQDLLSGRKRVTI